ncbi:hypothetical protein Tamer19_24870 [Cupriavidus sp. TA19]|uniref:hypothetical protein n=1 Tax=unclassified Cupriavidus TaxID=2640874 RepID=UPI0027294260|nr:hypothetical protein [Cupriavidus sp. TA19]GLC93079.1 hypothetical protein Tamer19_24870 [Cupriavidus sp. TA19]
MKPVALGFGQPNFATMARMCATARTWPPRGLKLGPSARAVTGYHSPPAAQRHGGWRARHLWGIVMPYLRYNENDFHLRTRRGHAGRITAASDDRANGLEA